MRSEQRRSRAGLSPPESIADALATAGWSVCSNFLPAKLARALAKDARQRFAAGEFSAARVGSGSSRALRAEVRGDSILWLESPGANAAQRECLGRFEGLRLTVNRELQLGLFDFECHYALYPPGAFYRRHLDRFQGDARRLLSCALYLNEGWGAADAGELCLYLPGEGGRIDVPPQCGKLVAFLSERFEHEVRPARRERLSLAGWFRQAGAPAPRLASHS